LCGDSFLSQIKDIAHFSLKNGGHLLFAEKENMKKKMRSRKSIFFIQKN